MPSLSPLELLVVGVIALIVFGPHKLPEMARTVGRALNELKRMASEVRSEFEMGLDDVEDEPEETPPDTRTAPATDEVPGPDAEEKPPVEPAAGAGTEEGRS